MYQGSYQNRPQRRRRRRNRKPALLMMALALLLGAIVGSTLAYLFTNTGSVTNSFVPASITTKIDEDFPDHEVKNNVKVTNTGDVEAYIRAAVVVTWQDSEGKVYPTAPVEGTDYTVTWTMDSWVEKDGYYYYISSVAPGASTGILLTGCKPVEGKAPENYHLIVEVLSSAIQSEPVDAIRDAWGVTISNGNVTAVTG